MKLFINNKHYFKNIPIKKIEQLQLFSEPAIQQKQPIES